MKLFGRMIGTGMNLSHKLVWFAGDDRAGAQPFAACRIFPSFPQCGERPLIFVESRLSAENIQCSGKDATLDRGISYGESELLW
jgi:hypothetical protein